MNEWVERLALCKQWLERQKEEQVLTGGGCWIRKGAKSRRRVIGRNHSFPPGRDRPGQGRWDATRMPLCQVSMREFISANHIFRPLSACWACNVVQSKTEIILGWYTIRWNKRTPKSTVLSKKKVLASQMTQTRRLNCASISFNSVHTISSSLIASNLIPAGRS